MLETDCQPAATSVEPSIHALALWSIVAAFGAYFCMYAFRKPFTAASFSGATVWGLGEKSVLVTAQVLGYTTSKWIGIRVIAETPPRRRAVGILILMGWPSWPCSCSASRRRRFTSSACFSTGCPWAWCSGWCSDS